MSGGYFNYQQQQLQNIAEMIDELISTNDNTDLDEWGDTTGHQYPSDIIEKFDETRKTLRLAAAMTQRIDWLVSGDDGEDSFRERWKEEVDSVRY